MSAFLSTFENIGGHSMLILGRSLSSIWIIRVVLKHV